MGRKMNNSMTISEKQHMTYLIWMCLVHKGTRIYVYTYYVALRVCTDMGQHRVLSGWHGMYKQTLCNTFQNCKIVTNVRKTWSAMKCWGRPPFRWAPANGKIHSLNGMDLQARPVRLVGKAVNYRYTRDSCHSDASYKPTWQILAK